MPAAPATLQLAAPQQFQVYTFLLFVLGMICACYAPSTWYRTALLPHVEKLHKAIATTADPEHVSVNDSVLDSIVLKVWCSGYRLSQLQQLHRPRADKLQSQVCQRQIHTRFHPTGVAPYSGSLYAHSLVD